MALSQDIINERMKNIAEKVKEENFKYNLPFFGSKGSVKLNPGESVIEIKNGRKFRISIEPGAKVNIIDTIN